MSTSAIERISHPHVGERDCRRRRWHVIRVEPGLDELVKRLTLVEGFDHHEFRFIEPHPRRRPSERRYFPGYHFIGFDVELDPWERLFQMPGVLELFRHSDSLLPIPIADAVWDDLRLRLPYKPRMELIGTFIPVGARARVKPERLDGRHEGMVLACDGKMITLGLRIFGRDDVPTTFRVSDVEEVKT